MSEHHLLLNSKNLMACLLLTGLAWFFIELAVWVVDQQTNHFDRRLLLTLRDKFDVTNPVGPKWFEELMRDITGLGGNGVLTFLVLSCAATLWLVNKPRLALALLISISVGLVLSFVLKAGFARPRPDLVPHGSHVYTSSFPSGHSMMSALVYFTLAGLLSQALARFRLRVLMLVLAFVLVLSVGFSRVYLGVHWPTDVFAGWCAGSFWALLTLRLARFAQHKGWLESPSQST